MAVENYIICFCYESPLESKLRAWGLVTKSSDPGKQIESAKIWGLVLYSATKLMRLIPGTKILIEPPFHSTVNFLFSILIVNNNHSYETKIYLFHFLVILIPRSRPELIHRICSVGRYQTGKEHLWTFRHSFSFHKFLMNQKFYRQ